MAEKSFIQLMAEENPVVKEAFFNLADTMKTNTGLDEKTYQLVYIGIKSAAGQVGSVITHTGFAKKAGATRDEVIGAVLITLMTNGVTGVSSCLQAAIDAYDKE